jgi:hypothetical protein
LQPDLLQCLDTFLLDNLPLSPQAVGFRFQVSGICQQKAAFMSEIPAGDVRRRIDTWLEKLLAGALSGATEYGTFSDPWSGR